MIAPGGLDWAHAESLLAAGYALVLLLIGFGVERMAHRTHRRAHDYATRGFVYHAHLDVWQCPNGQHLQPITTDEARRLIHYRAPAAACNRCPLKSNCTDSETGREVTRSLDSWLETDVGRFHRGLSLVLSVLAGMIVTVALVRRHADADVLVLLSTLVVVLFTVRRRFGALRRPQRLGSERLTQSALRPTQPLQ